MFAHSTVQGLPGFMGGHYLGKPWERYMFTKANVMKHIWVNSFASAMIEKNTGFGTNTPSVLWEYMACGHTKHFEPLGYFAKNRQYYMVAQNRNGVNKKRNQQA